jgi:POT family proton-dependent oligopeptide transporter
MFVGLVQYSIGRKNLPEETHHVPHPLERSARVRYVAAAVVAVVVVTALVLAGVITAARLADIVVGVVVVASVVYFAVILSSRQITAVERSRVWSFVPMFIANAVFWSLYQQQFTVVEIYSDKRLDRMLFGWEMPVSWVQSINPVFIILLAPLFAALWTRWGSRQPSSPVKFGVATVVMGVAFLPFLLIPSGAHAAPLLAIVGILLLFTIAELLISPVGLSLSTKLAPGRFHTQMVALYFLSVALGTAMAGKLAGYYDPTDETGYFLFIGLVAIAVGLVLLALTKPIRRLMAGVH